MLCIYFSLGENYSQLRKDWVCYMRTRRDVNLNRVCGGFIHTFPVIFRKPGFYKVILVGLNLNSSKLWWSHSASFISSLRTANIATRATRSYALRLTELGDQKPCWPSQVGRTSVGWRGYVANKTHLGNSMPNSLILQMRSMNRFSKPRHISWKL